MSVEVRIVGQGLAGSLLGWACERAGITFAIEDVRADFDGNSATLGFAPASVVGAGIINPITGQRLVKSWRVDTLLPIAVAMYREIEAAVGRRFLFPYRLRRSFADERERAVAREKWARGDFAGFGQSLDDDGLWVEPAYRVDLDGLVRALHDRWQKSGNWTARRSQIGGPNVEAPLTIRCLGASELAEEPFAWAKMIPVKGELIEIETAGGALDPHVILNCREWLVPLGGSRALVGATVEPGRFDVTATVQALDQLAGAAKKLLGEVGFQIVAHRAGIRVVSSDKHPVIGRHPEQASLGIFNALGSKGALLAPWLAQQWLKHLQSGQPIDPAVEVARFWK